jgi:hypothetical protein
MPPANLLYMKFQVNDLVRKNEENGGLYTVVAVRTYEPCCQLQLRDNASSKHWAITEELELVSRESDRDSITVTKQSSR